MAEHQIDATMDSGNEKEEAPATVRFVDEVKVATEENGVRKQNEKERSRHYDRDEIRQFMQRQKKERKEKKRIGEPEGYVCNHSRSPSKGPVDGRPPVKRSKPKSTTVSHEAVNPSLATSIPLSREENWGPYESPNFLQALAPSVNVKIPIKNSREGFSRQPVKTISREKSIQTDQEQPVMPSTSRLEQVDEATQMTDDADEWLHVVPSRPTSASRPITASAAPVANLSLEQLRTVSNSSVGTSFLLQRSTEPQEPTSPSRNSRREPKVKSPAQKLVRQIETLEHYIDHMLDAPPFHALTKPLPASATFNLPYSSMGNFPLQPPLPRTTMENYAPPARSIQPPISSAPAPFRLVDEGDSHRPLPPPRSSSSHRPKLDTTASTLYHDLPDRLNEFLRISRRSRSDERKKPLPALPVPDRASDLKYLFRNADEQLQLKRRANEKPVQYTEDTGLGSLFPLPPGTQYPDAVESKKKTMSTANRMPEEPQTYFRDFNEILRMDPNPLTERSNSWKRGLTSKQSSGDQMKLPPSAPYNILSAISDELALTMHRLPARVPLNNTSDSDFLSRISIPSETGSEEPVDAVDKARRSSDRRNNQQSEQPKNGQSSRTGASAELRGSGTVQGSQLLQQAAIGQQWAELDTTYLTLTPQYTSFEVSNVRSGEAEEVPDSSVIPEEVEEEEKDHSSIFSTKFSPIPKAVSPLSLVSDSEPSGMDLDRKQSTSSSDRSERERSVGDKLVESSVSRLVTPPRRRSTSKQKHQKPMTSTDKKPVGGEDLLARLRSEMQRDENLFRSIQQVDRLEDSQDALKNQPFRVQFDPQTRSFFQSQTEALQAIAHDVRSGLSALTAQPNTSAAFLQGSQAAMEIDRTQQQKNSIRSLQYSPNFEPKSDGNSPDGTLAETESWVATDQPSQPSTKPTRTQHARRSPTTAATGVDNSSDSAPLSDSQSSSILPPRAVDLLLQEEAKQQRLLLKLREKAQVEKTLAELELLQMQKRILRAQGEREKAASIKKRQRGLLLKLQEERARIEALRRQHKKEEQKSQAHNNSEHHYESSWETDWSAASTSASVVAAAAVDNSMSIREVVDQYDESNDSSTSTLHPSVSEDICPGSVNVGDRLDARSDAIGSTEAAGGADAMGAVDLSESKSEVEGGASAVSSLRLRAPLSPRTSNADGIRVRMKFRRRHSSGSDDSINLSQNGKLSLQFFFVCFPLFNC